MYKLHSKSCRCSRRRIVAIKRQVFRCFKKIVCFFAASPHRWDVLLKHASIALKRVIDRRWSAHHPAAKTLHAGCDRTMDALKELCNPNENLNARVDAHSILVAIQIFSFLCFWKVILRESHDTQTYFKQQTVSAML